MSLHPQGSRENALSTTLDSDRRGGCLTCHSIHQYCGAEWEEGEGCSLNPVGSLRDSYYFEKNPVNLVWEEGKG